MKKIAIIAPLILPVPAVEGGAVEGLITRIIIDNETRRNFQIDLYTINDERYDISNYQYTDIITIDESVVKKTIDKATDSIYRRAKRFSSIRLIDSILINCFSKKIEEYDEPYAAIVVENHMSTALKILEFCNGRYEIPIFFHMHNNVDIYRSPQYIRKLVKYGVQFIAVSKYIKSEIINIDKNAVVHVLYNGIDLEECRKLSDFRPLASKLLYSGRIIPAKGVREMLIAFIKLLETLDIEERSKLKLDIIGFSQKNTKYEKDAMRLAASYPENITCKKKMAHVDILDKYLEYDAVIMPTINMEPFGLVALEALGNGIPLVTTNSGALPEVVGDAALIVDKERNVVEHLKEALGKVIFDKKLRKELSDKGYRRVKSIPEFDIKNYYRGFSVILDPHINAKEKISVIVPVYNVEEYLERCVDSIIGQDYGNIEIILVDDGSTDSSGSICDRYLCADNRIKVIHQDNLGLSAARNTGLKEAVGNFIFFCDSDDYIEPKTLSTMARVMARDNADIVACGIRLVGDENALFTTPRCGKWSGHEAVIQMMRTNNICSVAWNKLYKRTLFNDVKYPVGALHEDEATTYKLLFNSGIVSYIPTPFYNYYKRTNGIMSGKISDRSRFFIEAIEDRIRFFEESDDKELVNHSRITLLDGIKYAYRNSMDDKQKNILLKKYRSKVNIYNVPKEMGVLKAVSLLMWKCIQY